MLLFNECIWVKRIREDDVLQFNSKFKYIRSSKRLLKAFMNSTKAKSGSPATLHFAQICCYILGGSNITRDEACAQISTSTKPANIEILI